jgi:hypothetical protein
MESIYEYGSRAGFWRAHRMLNDPAGDGLRRCNRITRPRTGTRDESPWLGNCHGLVTNKIKDMPEDEERAQIAEANLVSTQKSQARCRAAGIRPFEQHSASGC